MQPDDSTSGSPLKYIARAARLFERGIITDEEFVGYLSDSLASEQALPLETAADLLRQVPKAAQGALVERIEMVLQPGYRREPFALGGKPRTESERLEAGRRETAREREWALELKRLVALQGLEAYLYG